MIDAYYSFGVIDKYKAKAFERVAFGQNANFDASPMTEALASPLWTPNLTNGQHQAMQLSGGVARVNSSATLSSVGEILRGTAIAGGGGAARYPVFFGTTQKFYVAARFAIGAINNTAQCVVAGRGDSTGGLTWKMGGNGASSTAKYTALVNIGSPSTLTSSINVDANVYHTHEIWSDGTNTYYSVDNEAYVTAAKLPDEQSVFSFSARNGATAVDRNIDLDWFVAVSDGQ